MAKTTHKYILQVVVETEKEYTKKAMRLALNDELGSARLSGDLGFESEQITGIERIYVRREVDKQ